nr:hypothetical protein [Pseudomonas sp. BIGb0427]
MLDLDHNPLASPPDVTALSRLRLLRLRNTAITTVPAGLLSRPVLESADLREKPHRGVAGGPVQRPAAHPRTHQLPRQSAQRREPRTLAGVRARRFVAGGRRLQSRALRQPAGGVADGVARRGARAARPAMAGTAGGEEGSADLFRLLGDLRETADFRRRRQDLTRRVWEVLEGCYDDTGLRNELFALAGAPRSCSDSVALNFSALEVRAHELTATRGL